MFFLYCSSFPLLFIAAVKSACGLVDANKLSYHVKNYNNNTKLFIYLLKPFVKEPSWRYDDE